MKIEYFWVEFQAKKMFHFSSTGLKEFEMESRKLEAIPPMLAHIEDYAVKNGFDVLNATSEGTSLKIFLVKKS